MMNYQEIQDLIRLIAKTNLTEFKIKEGEFELSIRTKNYSKGKEVEYVAAPAPVALVPQAAVSATPTSIPAAAAVQPADAPTPAPAPPAVDVAATGGLLEVKSPIVGTFYRSPGPDKPAFVKVGDVIKAGTVVCIVEAMKLFNEIESEIGGKIVKVMVEDASPVEYDQVLFLVDPKG